MRYILVVNTVLLIFFTLVLAVLISRRLNLKKLIYEPLSRLNSDYLERRLRREVKKYTRTISIKMSFAEKVELELIDKSNIRSILPFMNFYTLHIICAIIFALSFDPIYRILYFLPSTIIICFLIAMIPVFILDLLGRYNSEKVRRDLADFIAVLNRWCAVKEDIFYAFEKSVDSGIGEPLRTFIKDMNTQVKRGIDPIEVLDILRIKVDNAQFRDFILNIKQTIRSSGDIRKLLTNMEAQFYRIEEEYIRRKISLYKDRMVIYATMFIVLFAGFYFIKHNSQVQNYYLGTVEGKLLFTLFSVIYVAAAYLSTKISKFNY